MPEPKRPVPRLRFPEFRGAEPWEVKRLGELFTFSSGSTPPKGNVKLWSGSLPWISASSMYDTRIERSDHYISEDAVKNGAAIAEQGAILLLVRGSMLFKRIPVGVAARRVSFNQDVKALTAKMHGANITFFLHYLTSLEWLLLSKVLPTGIGAGKLDTSDLIGLEIAVPSSPEQQKIADCLTSLDDLIRAEKEAVEALRDHKRGLMQQLFPRAGETTPRLRFPEFRDAGPWEVKRLGDVFDERIDRGGERQELLSVTMTHGVIRASDLDRRSGASPDLSNYKRVTPGDIVYNSMRMWQGASGVAEHQGLVSPAYTVVTPKETHVSAFWGFYFKYPPNTEKFAQFSQGVTSDTWNLKFPAFAAIKMAVPLLTAEQQKIADCLGSLDDLIRAEEEAVEALRAHKTGLMQQLFPQEAR